MLSPDAANELFKHWLEMHGREPKELTGTCLSGRELWLLISDIYDQGYRDGHSHTKKAKLTDHIKAMVEAT